VAPKALPDVSLKLIWWLETLMCITKLLPAPGCTQSLVQMIKFLKIFLALLIGAIVISPRLPSPTLSQVAMAICIIVLSLLFLFCERETTKGIMVSKNLGKGYSIGLLILASFCLTWTNSDYTGMAVCLASGVLALFINHALLHKFQKA